jgi:hypothetical protein
MAIFALLVACNGVSGSPQGSNIDATESGRDVPLKEDFEENGRKGLPEGWHIMPGHSGRGRAVIDRTIFHSGKGSLRLSPGRGNKAEGFGVFIILNPETIKGKKVTISGYARLEGMGTEPAALLLKTDKDNWLILPQKVQKKFFHFSKTFAVSDRVSKGYLFFIAGGKKGSVWLDDLLITIDGDILADKEVRRPLRPSNSIYVNKINTPGWQDSAFISPDGRELYFAYMPYTQKDHRDILLGRLREEDIKIKGPIRPGSYTTMEFETFKSVKKKDGSWGTPVYVKVKDATSIYAAKTSFDGRLLYYVMRDYPGGYGSGDIYVSRKLPEGVWGPPMNLGPNINSDANEDTPCISSDGKTLYFARNRGDALGFEIMVSHKVNGKWTKARKMPYPINERWSTLTANHQPFITADGNEFYFTRVQQLYMSRKRKDGDWSKPEPVFPDLPVSGHASVTADGKYLYFLTAGDEESLRRESWSIWYSERMRNGRWGKPRPVD